MCGRRSARLGRGQGTSGPPLAGRPAPSFTASANQSGHHLDRQGSDRRLPFSHSLVPSRSCHRPFTPAHWRPTPFDSSASTPSRRRTTRDPLCTFWRSLFPFWTTWGGRLIAFVHSLVSQVSSHVPQGTGGSFARKMPVAPGLMIDRLVVLILDIANLESSVYKAFVAILARTRDPWRQGRYIPV